MCVCFTFSVVGFFFTLTFNNYSSSFSLGCGIGYGYLHRIPTRPFEEGKKISFPGHTHSEPASPLKDGFTEVSTFACLFQVVNFSF